MENEIEVKKNIFNSGSNQIRIPMVDLVNQYKKYESEFDVAIKGVLNQANFINGKQVDDFVEGLSQWLGSKYVIPCANGTDALQIAFMSLGLNRGDEVIIPSFNYVAAAEAAVLLGLVPIFVDCDVRTFNISISQIRESITPRTKALVAVHLFGQGCDLEEIENFCIENNIFLIEDNAQSIGAEILCGKYSGKKLGTIGKIGTTSFFPSKNLGCMGDGGAIFCQTEELFHKIKMIVNHGQKIRYEYDMIGMNSRLDTVQASILSVKLKHIDDFIRARVRAAKLYNQELANIVGITLPMESMYTNHVYHQYTITFDDKNHRDSVKRTLDMVGIQSMIYYPKPLHLQPAYLNEKTKPILPNSFWLGDRVLSLPIHSEMSDDLVSEITHYIKS